MNNTEQAKRLLEHFDAMAPANANDLRELDKERGWVEAIR